MISKLPNGSYYIMINNPYLQQYGGFAWVQPQVNDSCKFKITDGKYIKIHNDTNSGLIFFVDRFGTSWGNQLIQDGEFGIDLTSGRNGVLISLKSGKYPWFTDGNQKRNGYMFSDKPDYVLQFIPI